MSLSIRNDIEKMENDLARLQNLDESTRNRTEEARLLQRLEWAYNEVRYVAPNRSVTANPRASDATTRAPENVRISLTSIPENRREIAQKIIDGFAAAGYGTVQQVAALANAKA